MIRPLALPGLLLIALGLPGQGALAQAGSAPPAAPAVAPAPTTARNPAPIGVIVEAGNGRLLQLPARAAAVLAADPRVARVQPASPTSLFVIGVGAGRTNIVATAENGQPVAEFEVTVRGGRPPEAPVAASPAASAAAPRAIPAAAIQAAIRQLLPGGTGLEARAAGQGAILLRGTVATAADAERAAAIARGFLENEQTVLNELEVLSSVQVNVRVRVLEMSRTVSRELGFNWQALGNSGSFLFGLRNGANANSVANAILGSATLATAPPARLAAAFRSSRADINAVIDTLAQDRLVTVLAEPNLTAQSGESASFLAGGEFPIPVSATITGQISIQFKQFGVSLSFVPTVLGPDRLNLRVRPEVSDLSENGAISVPLANGTVRIPALTVRRADTTVELGSGESFGIAGLLQRSSTQVNDAVAGLGEVPILGALFRSDRFQRSETELVIIVTPYLVRPAAGPQHLSGPTDGFRPATDLERVLHRRQIARGEAPRATPAAALNAGFLLD